MKRITDQAAALAISSAAATFIEEGSLRTVSNYAWHTNKLTKPMRLAVISDLHDTAYEDLWPLVSDADCLLIPGDVANRYRQSYGVGLRFLQEASQRLPTFFSIGNHEMRMRMRTEMLNALRRSPATLLLNDYIRFGECWIGGWYRPAQLAMRDMADEFARLEGCKILMCHRPEDYWKHLRGRNIDLVLAGHAHGGQIRLGEQGLYAPGQGVFPRFTKGVTDGRMIISAGVSNPVWLPRWGNPCEVVRIDLD
ncbi:MAG: metallophosphoesterase [Clostridia bacterium]|nr:metallophosphoesterase [Clostridia bacterium]